MPVRTRLIRMMAWRHAGIAALLAIALAGGLPLADDFGAGADEALGSMVGSRGLNALAGPDGYRDYVDTGELIAHHGPSYFMLFTVASRLFERLFADWLPSDGRHLTNFLTFLVGVAFFYSICLRLLPRRVAWVTTALFATQPVVFGLGFIDHKDTPFMAFFTASLAAGLWVTDRWGGPASSTPAAGQDKPIRRTAQREWQAASRGSKWVLLGALALFVFVLVDILLYDRILRGLESALGLAYRGRAWGPLDRLFTLVAADAYKTPLEAYLPKLRWAYLAYGKMAVVSASLLAGLLAARRALPSTLRSAVPGGRAVQLLALLAGAILGFAVSIRAIAGFAGLLVSGYWIYRMRGRSLGLLGVYWAAAGIVSYQTWPYLWEAPLAAFLGSLALHTDFTVHEVLYRGVVYGSDNLPWHYLPALFGLQLTEPVVPMAVVGVIRLTKGVTREGLDPGLLAIIGLWFLVPLAATFLPNAGLYNGFRHVLFVIPTIFIGLGFGLSLIFQAVRWQAAAWLVCGALLAPGLLGIAWLHPYEYAYFNAYAGGVEGADGIYDHEYWCTSYREAMEFVNRVAQPGDVVFSGRSLFSAVPFARTDLILTAQASEYERATYVLYCSRFREDLVWVSGEKRFEVARGSAVFAQVFQRVPGPIQSP